MSSSCIVRCPRDVGQSAFRRQREMETAAEKWRERERGGYNIETQLLYVQCSSSTQGEREEYMYTRTNERTMALLQLITTIRCWTSHASFRRAVPRGGEGGKYIRIQGDGNGSRVECGRTVVQTPPTAGIGIGGRSPGSLLYPWQPDGRYRFLSLFFSLPPSHRCEHSKTEKEEKRRWFRTCEETRARASCFCSSVVWMLQH